MLVTVKFNTPQTVLEATTKEIREYLLINHKYEIKEDALMRDLLFEILREIAPEKEYEWDDNYLYSRFTGIIDGEECDINVDFPASRFIEANSIDGVLGLIYHPFLRGGWGVSLTSEIRLIMPSGEKGHEKTPHVHVRKGKYQKGNENTVRVKLSDLSIMDNAEQKVKRLFDKNQWGCVMRVLKENREQLMDNYNKMLKGAMTEMILLNLDEETSQTIPARFQL